MGCSSVNSIAGFGTLYQEEELNVDTDPLYGTLLTVLLCLGPAWWKSQEL